MKSAYLECDGDMDVIMDSVMCATVDDEDRFRDLLNDLITKKEVPSFKKFTKEKKVKKSQRKKRVRLISCNIHILGEPI